MSQISIPKGAINLAGLIFTPPTSETTAKSPAIIIVHPGGGVKEQTASLYAQKLALKGFTTIAYDASFQGSSGGSPHFLENPAERVSDIGFVVDYLERQTSINASKISVVGICAGGGYAIAAVTRDHRIKAVATVSMVNIGDGARKGWYGDEDAAQHATALDAVAQQISAENLGAEYATAPYVPPTCDDNTPNDLREASEYYLTPRAHHSAAENKMLVRSTPLLMTFDAFLMTDIFLTQPTLLIAGEEAESKWHTEKLEKLLGGKAKTIYVPKAKHMDFYDRLVFVNPAVDQIEQFFKANVK